MIIESPNFSKFHCSKYNGQISFYLVFPKLMELYRISVLNQHITICRCIKFQSIWRTLHFGTKFAQNYMNDKILKKQTLKPKQACSNVPLQEISVNLENFKFWDQICPKNYEGQIF